MSLRHFVDDDPLGQVFGRIAVTNPDYALRDQVVEDAVLDAAGARTGLLARSRTTETLHQNVHTSVAGAEYFEAVEGKLYALLEDRPSTRSTPDLTHGRTVASCTLPSEWYRDYTSGQRKDHT